MTRGDRRPSSHANQLRQGAFAESKRLNHGRAGSRLTGEGASQYHSRAPRGLSFSMPLRPPT
jgi:hypothetical protein